MANAFAAAATKARSANEARYTQGMSLWDEIIQRYQPGGAFGAGALASYERGKTKALGAGMQQLVSSGLANTTVAATMGKKYEEEVGTPFRLQLEDMRMDRLSGAQEGQAGFIERREDVGPSGALAMQSGMQAGMVGAYGSGQSKLVRNQGFPSGGGGGGQRTPPAPGSTSYQGANYQATRGGSPYQYGGPDIGRITYQGEQSAAPTYGEPGGPAGPPAPGGTDVSKMTVADFAKMGARNEQEQALYKQWLALKGGKVAPTTSKSTVGTTSYAAKGGGFGGRGF